jgi:hypothetical protein
VIRVFCPETFLFTSQNMHMGYSTEILVRFLKTRDANVAKALKKWLVKSFGWNFNQIDCSLHDLLAYLKILF